MRRAIWLAALVVACGGDDSAAGDDKLSELDAQQLAGVCERVDARFARFEKAYVSASCTQMALMNPNTCEATRAACIQNTNPQGALAGKVEFTCQGPGSLVETCPEITVDEADECGDDIIGGIEALAEKISCSADLDMLEPPETPGSCRKLGARCPSLADFKL